LFYIKRDVVINDDANIRSYYLRLELSKVDSSKSRNSRSTFASSFLEADVYEKYHRKEKKSIVLFLERIIKRRAVLLLGHQKSCWSCV